MQDDETDRRSESVCFLSGGHVEEGEEEDREDGEEED